ncbi:uncharacterized protein SPSK_10538 [Sporothrix schenckii 1099-18]|uniref:Uncharacterized protein n=1 Tax=Sporothrix schenckii 1099-18 TaxID=1397361 RepID=A0A0F2M0E1_SPOSC|nr:uncharacterized protein SPSK_10538 [Sporothrix schenckii 1099-18]KJR82539.1 hypothetical protein SPSK_10538 [Sporothrix schenckii 1099-18]
MLSTTSYCPPRTAIDATESLERHGSPRHRQREVMRGEEAEGRRALDVKEATNRCQILVDLKPSPVVPAVPLHVLCSPFLQHLVFHDLFFSTFSPPVIYAALSDPSFSLVTLCASFPSTSSRTVRGREPRIRKEKNAHGKEAQKGRVSLLP